MKLKEIAKYVGIGFVLGITIGLLLALARADAATDRAREAEARADASRIRAEADSVRAAELYAEYLAAEAEASEQEEAIRVEEARLAAIATEQERTRIRTRRTLDSLTALVPDTASFVPRFVFVAATSALDATELELETEKRRSVVLREDRDLWQGRYTRADSGWTAERKTSTRLRETLREQIRATEEWKRAASPPWGVRLLEDAKPFVAGVLATIGTKELISYLREK